MSSIEIKRLLAKVKLKLKFNEIKEAKEILQSMTDVVESEADASSILEQGKQIRKQMEEQECSLLAKNEEQEGKLQLLVQTMFKQQKKLVDLDKGYSFKVCCQFIVGNHYLGQDEALCVQKIFNLEDMKVVLTGNNYTYQQVKQVIDQKQLAVQGLYNNNFVDCLDINTLKSIDSIDVNNRKTRQLVGSSLTQLLFQSGEKLLLTSRQYELQQEILCAKVRHFLCMSDTQIMIFDTGNDTIQRQDIKAQTWKGSVHVAKVNMVKQCGQQAVVLHEASNRLLVYNENQRTSYDLYIYSLPGFELVTSYLGCGILCSSNSYFMVYQQQEYKIIRISDLKEVMKIDNKPGNFNDLLEIQINESTNKVVLYGSDNKQNLQFNFDQFKQEHNNHELDDESVDQEEIEASLFD